LVKIAYFINRYPHTSHSFIRREISALESLGLQIERISIRRSNATVDPADQAEEKKTFVIFDHLVQGIFLAIARIICHPLASLRALRMAMTLGFRHGRIVKHLLYWVEALALTQWLIRRDISHVHAHFGTNPAAIAMLCRIAGGATYSFTVHGPDEFDSPQALALGEKIHHASFVVAISEFTRSQLFRWSSVEDWKKIHVVHCGIDQDFFASSVTPIPEAPRLICLGRLCEQKGQLLLVQAVDSLVRHGASLELVLVGDGPMRGEIETLIAGFGLEQHVKITGWQSGAQVRQHILSARALVLPSFAEGLPVVIMESLALRRPVISTYVAGIPELVEHGVNGWLVPAGSVDRLKDCMAEALRLPPERLAEMGAAGARRVAECHDVAIEARKLASLFAQQASTARVQMPLGTKVETT
jgi:colanic acid/amylovoran biosynthesis glycosyltransferase